MPGGDRGSKGAYGGIPHRRSDWKSAGGHKAGQEKGKDFQYGADAYEAHLKESDPVEKNGREAVGKKQRDRAESHGR